MIRRSTIFSLFYKKLRVFVVVCSLWDIGAFSSTFLPQTFETCGIFLAVFQPISNEQGDVTHEIIELIQLSQKKTRSLMINVDLTKREIHPDIFKSMKYDCFLHVVTPSVTIPPLEPTVWGRREWGAITNHSGDGEEPRLVAGSRRSQSSPYNNNKIIIIVKYILGSVEL